MTQYTEVKDEAELVHDYETPLFSEWEKKRKNQDLWDANKAERKRMGIVTVEGEDGE